MQAQAHPCYLLHTRPYRETSLLLEAFSSVYGRVGLIARGARTNRTRQSTILQPLRRLSIAWKGRGELATLTSVEQEQAQSLAGQRLYSALYLNELLMRLLHRHEPQPELFFYYQQALDQLVSNEALQPLLRVFEKHLLEHIGYGLNLEEIHLDEESSAAIYWYQPGAGLVLQAPGSQPSVSSAALKALLLEEGFQSEGLRELKLLMRTILDTLLSGRPLHSRALFASISTASDEC